MLASGLEAVQCCEGGLESLRVEARSELEKGSQLAVGHRRRGFSDEKRLRNQKNTENEGFFAKIQRMGTPERIAGEFQSTKTLF